jgi:predicted nucleic acid-binding protein
MIYLDTSILVKSYLWESNSAEAIHWIEMVGEPILLSHFHRIEIPNAIRLKYFRKEITQEQSKNSLHTFQTDIQEARYHCPAYDLPEIFLRAEKLSARLTATIGSRSLDLLHITAAQEIGFYTFDTRQATVAEHCGLKVLPKD